MSLPRLYVQYVRAVTVSAVQDVFLVKASSTNGVELRRVNLTASGVSSPAEIELRLKRMTSAVSVGSGGSAPTIQKVSDRNGIAALSSVRANDTSQATTSGSTIFLADWNWQVLNPFEEVPPTPEERWECDVSEALVIEIAASPASTVISGFMVWLEV